MALARGARLGPYEISGLLGAGGMREVYGRMLSLGKPRRLFAFSEPPLRLRCDASRCYSVASDGQHFYTVRQAPTAPIPPVTQIHLIQNWTEELKARVPAGPSR